MVWYLMTGKNLKGVACQRGSGPYQEDEECAQYKTENRQTRVQNSITPEITYNSPVGTIDARSSLLGISCKCLLVHIVKVKRVRK
jgi:hypothetical protein